MEDREKANKIFKVLDVKIDALEPFEVVGKVKEWILSFNRKPAKYICVTNVANVIESQKSLYFKKVINCSDLSVCDGTPLAWLARAKRVKIKEKVRGFVLMSNLLEISQKEGYSNYFYGSSNKVLDKLASNAKERYPKLNICGVYSPPFRELSKDEKREIIENINRSKADIVWVGLGCPKQELWMYEFREYINSPVLIGVGAAFDFLAETKLQAPAWMQNSGLEWFFRLSCEPKRLWKRYLIGNSIFMWLLLKEFVKIKILRKRSNYD